MKRFIHTWALMLGGALLLAGCETFEPFVHSDNNRLSDIWLTIPGQKDARFNGTYSPDGGKVSFEIPFFYPAESDNEVDLSQLILRANIPLDARISPTLGNPMDLSQPRQIDVIAGTGEVRSFQVEVRKVVDLSVKSISIEVGGSEVTGFLRGNDYVFYVVPGLDVSRTKLNYQISRHATASIPSGSMINLSAPVPLTVTGKDGSEKVYQLTPLPPQALAYGIGITRKLWMKSGAELGGFGAHTETSMAVSGQHLIVGSNTTPSRYRIIDRMTGELIGNMAMPTASFRSFSMVSDEAGHILGSSFTPKNANLLIYKWENAKDATPELLITYKNESSSTVDGAVGRRMGVYGNLSTNAVIMATESRNADILRWVVTNGQVVSQTPEKITYAEASGPWPFVSDAQPVSAAPKSDFFLNYANEIALVSGSNGKRLAALPNTPGLVGVFHMPTDYFEFNHAKYLGIAEYLNSTLDLARIAIFDITDPANINGANPNTKVFVSDVVSGTANPNGTGDIEVFVSPAGDKAWAYLLLTNGGVIAYELTNFDPN